MDDEYREEAIHGPNNQAGSQSSPQNFVLPPTLVAHFPALPAPAHPTDLMTPFSTGSTSDLFRAIIKRPNPISLEINGELHSNAADIAVQFAAELRVYRKVGKNKGFVAYLGCVEGLGMVLEWVEGPTLLDILRGPSPPNAKVKLPPHKNPSKRRRIKWYNELVDALVHLHSFGLNHGDLSLLNIHVETRTDSIKLIDFGRSVSVMGYPCQNLYVPEVSPVTPTLKTDKKPLQPVVFRPGGAWIEPDNARGREGHRSSSQGRDPGRPKLYDRSSNSSTKPHLALGVVGMDEPPPPNPDAPSRPVTHASRLLHRDGQGGSLGTHMPITMSRAGRGQQDLSRPSSTSPLQTRFHLATSPMSPRDSNGRDRGGGDESYGYEQDDWMQVDAYGAPHSSASSTSRDYGYPHYSNERDPRNYGRSRQYGHDRREPVYYLNSPSHSRPVSRRPSRSPARYGSPAMYANSPHGYHHSHRSHSNSRHRSRTPPPPHHRSHHGSPYQYGYPDSPHDTVYAPPPPPPPPPEPPKPEQIHPGSRPFCAPEILRASHGTCIDSKTKQWIDPILADAYSLGIVLVCMDLCKLVDIGNEKQKREDGKFPDLSGTTIFTELIRAYTRPAAERERISLEKKIEVPEEEEEEEA